MRGERQVFRPDYTHGVEGFAQEAAAARSVAAVLIGVLVGVYGKEALRQIAVREVQLQLLIARIARMDDRLHEVVAHTRDIVQRHGARHLWQVIAEGDGGRRNRLPTASVVSRDMVVAFLGFVSARFETRVANLDTPHGACRFDRLRDLRQIFGLRVIP